MPAIIILGIITSYEDLKYEKIRNKYILSALIFSLIVNIGMIIFIYLKDNYINTGYILELLTTTVLALALGAFLWYNQFWTSGDAKLYVAYSALLPLSVYSINYIKYFPSLTILINTFIPLGLIFFIKALFKTSYIKGKNTLKKIFSFKRLLSYVLFIFVIMWIPALLFSLFKIRLSFIGLMVIIIIFSISIRKVFKKKNITALILISIARLIFDKSIYTYVFVQDFFILLIVLVIFRSFFIELGKCAFSEKIKIKKLCTGMIILDKIYKKKSKYFKAEENSLDNPNKTEFHHTGNGLTKKDIKKLNRLHSQKKLDFSYVRINRSTPFGHFLFGGVILTLIFNGNIISAILESDNIWNIFKFSWGYFWIIVTSITASVCWIIKTKKVK